LIEYLDKKYRLIFGEKMSMEKHRVAQNQLAVKNHEMNIYQEQKTKFSIEEIIGKKTMIKLGKQQSVVNPDLLKLESRMITYEEKVKTRKVKEKGVDTETQLSVAVGSQISKVLRSERMLIVPS
jgi:hypothetical protein